MSIFNLLVSRLFQGQKCRFIRDLSDPSSEFQDYTLDPQCDLYPILAFLPDRALLLRNWIVKGQCAHGLVLGTLNGYLQQAGLTLSLKFTGVDFKRNLVVVNWSNISVDARFDLYGDQTCYVDLEGQLMRSDSIAQQWWKDLQLNRYVLCLSTTNQRATRLRWSSFFRSSKYLDVDPISFIEFLQLPEETWLESTIIYDLESNAVCTSTFLRTPGFGRKNDLVWGFQPCLRFSKIYDISIDTCRSCISYFDFNMSLGPSHSVSVKSSGRFIRRNNLDFLQVRMKISGMDYIQVNDLINWIVGADFPVFNPSDRTLKILPDKDPECLISLANSQIDSCSLQVAVQLYDSQDLPLKLKAYPRQITPVMSIEEPILNLKLILPTSMNFSSETGSIVLIEPTLNVGDRAFTVASRLSSGIPICRGVHIVNISLNKQRQVGLADETKLVGHLDLKDLQGRNISIETQSLQNKILWLSQVPHSLKFEDFLNLIVEESLASKVRAVLQIEILEQVYITALVGQTWTLRAIITLNGLKLVYHQQGTITSAGNIALMVADSGQNLRIDSTDLDERIQISVDGKSATLDLNFGKSFRI